MGLVWWFVCSLMSGVDGCYFCVCSVVDMVGICLGGCFWFELLAVHSFGLML